MKLLNASKDSIWAAILAALSSPVVQDKLLAFVKKKAVEKITIQLLKATGIKAYIINLLIAEAIEKGDEHLIEPAFRKIGYAGDYLQGAKVFIKVSDAENINDWLDAVKRV